MGHLIQQETRDVLGHFMAYRCSFDGHSQTEDGEDYRCNVFRDYQRLPEDVRRAIDAAISDGKVDVYYLKIGDFHQHVVFKNRLELVYPESIPPAVEKNIVDEAFNLATNGHKKDLRQKAWAAVIGILLSVVFGMENLWAGLTIAAMVAGAFGVIFFLNPGGYYGQLRRALLHLYFGKEVPLDWISRIDPAEIRLSLGETPTSRA